jgi:hypothetical protein
MLEKSFAGTVDVSLPLADGHEDGHLSTSLAVKCLQRCARVVDDCSFWTTRCSGS